MIVVPRARRTVRVAALGSLVNCERRGDGIGIILEDNLLFDGLSTALRGIWLQGMSSVTYESGFGTRPACEGGNIQKAP